MDSASLQHTLATEKSVAQLFYEFGISVNTRVNKNVWTGIQRVKQYFNTDEGRAKIYIFSCCAEMIREIKSYRYSSSESPVKRDDHAMDELRYFVMSRPEASREEKQKSPQMRDMERLIRRQKIKKLN